MTKPVDKNCKSVEWWTPERVLVPVREYFGGSISLDPATAPSNPPKADRFFTSSENGLEMDWEDGTFVNPPYGPEIKDWIRKIKEEAEAGREIIALLPASRWEQQYFQECVFNHRLDWMCLIRKRLQFFDGNKKEVCKSNPYASVLYGYNISQWRLFRDCMETIGSLARIWNTTVHGEK